MGLGERFRTKPKQESPRQEPQSIQSGLTGIDTNEDSKIFHLAGAIEVLTSEALEEQILSEINTNVILDIEHVNYVSSAGLRMFYNIKKFCDSQGLTFGIINVTEHIFGLFRMTGYATIMKLEKKEE